MTEEHEVVIQFRNVTKTFDLFKNDKQRLKSLLFHNTNAKKKVAIDNLSFDIRQGEAVAILGKNGAGKSTMLKMISGVTFPTVGSVRVTGRVSALLEVSGGFDPELSGRENIYFRGELLGISREVFERSAFIRQSGLAITQDAGLERRVASLISSGEEDASYTEAYDTSYKVRAKCDVNSNGEGVDTTGWKELKNTKACNSGTIQATMASTKFRQLPLPAWDLLKLRHPIID